MRLVGPPAARPLRLMTDEASPGEAPRAPRRRRLSRSADFERVYRQGRSKANRFLVLYEFPQTAEPGGQRQEAEGPRLGLSVSRRVGGAVTRTHVKRMVREAFWAEARRLPARMDYVVVARPDAGPLAEREGMKGILPALAELVDGMGGGARPGPGAGGRP